MAKATRKLWEELLEIGRRLVKEIDDFLDPKVRQPRKPARAPVPVDKRRADYRPD